MSSDLIVKWTAIFTNIAVFVGLIFVGLEFRNNTRDVEWERIDGFSQGGSEIQRIFIEDPELSDILIRAYASSESLAKNELDWAQH